VSAALCGIVKKAPYLYPKNTGAVLFYKNKQKNSRPASRKSAVFLYKNIEK
jgi:hypothetical protein